MIDIDAWPVPTWTESETLRYLNSVASRSKTACEVGVYMGASARAILQNNDVHLWAADKFMVFGTEAVTRLVLDRWIKASQCEIIVGDSKKALEIIPVPLDMAWVDNGHTENDVKRDVQAMWQLLKPGGLLIGHDWEGDNDVARGVKAVFPWSTIEHPCPRVWQIQKP